jgi:hypothetical protein
MMFFLLLFAIPAFADFTPADSAKAKAYCRGEFKGTTIAVEKQSEASSRAKAEIISNIVSEVEAQANVSEFKKELGDGRIETSSGFSEISQIKSKMVLHDFQQIESPKRLENGLYELKGYVCNSNVAKPYLEKQRILADEMKIAKDWNKIKNNWNEFRDIQILLEGLRVESKYLASAKKSYEEAKDRCTAKLHWNPENKTAYSDIAFSKLSGVGMETSDCKGKGVKLAYNGAEAKCRKAGMHQCIHKPSLAISSCKDEKHRLLEGDEIKVYEKTEEAALETLQESLRNGTFWNKWEQEIKQWRPKCD